MNNDNIGFLFDLDGVLIDSESEYTRIWEEIDRHFPTGIENFAIRIKGQTLPEILNANFSPEIHSNVIDMLNSMEQRMSYRMLPGAQEMLDTLRTRGIGCVGGGGAYASAPLPTTETGWMIRNCFYLMRMH